MNELSQHKATLKDLPAIIALYSQDELGKTREFHSQQLDQRYVDAFYRIKRDPNQYLMVVKRQEEIVATCQLTLLPSLTFMGATRLQIEAVHVAAKHQGQKIGEWMMNAAFEFAKINNASIIQLTTNKLRTRAKQFYERLGFEATHEGMKYYLQDRQ